MAICAASSEQLKRMKNGPTMNQSASPIWLQKSIQLPALSRGFHLVTRQVLGEFPELARIEIGMLHVFIQHTSASLSLNENADPDVRVDMETAINHVVPENLNYVHTLEGPDDMPAHVKSSLLGASISVPVTHGRPQFGTWQGIYLCEHRDRATGRSLILTAFGRP